MTMPLPDSLEIQVTRVKAIESAEDRERAYNELLKSLEDTKQYKEALILQQRFMHEDWMAPW